MRKTVTIFLSTLLLGVFANNSVAEEAITPLRTFVSVDEFAKLQSELAKKFKLLALTRNKENVGMGNEYSN